MRYIIRSDGSTSRQIPTAIISMDPNSLLKFHNIRFYRKYFRLKSKFFFEISPEVVVFAAGGGITTLEVVVFAAGYSREREREIEYHVSVKYSL